MVANPSICIPRIESDINKQIINNTFKNFGTVERIDIVNSGEGLERHLFILKDGNILICFHD